MEEPEYTVASGSETTGEEKSSPLPNIAVGIDIGTSQCSVAVWKGSQVELLKNQRNRKLMKSYVTFKDEGPSGGVTNHLSNEHEILSGDTIFNIKRLIGRVDTDPVVRASKNLPFLVQTLDIGVRPYIGALVNNVWRFTSPEEALAIFLVELRLMTEAHLKRPIRNVVLSVPVSFSRFQLTRLERACAMAGLHILRLMPEPTAVAMLYGQQQLKASQESMDSASEKIALIFNMGAGYCDVAVTATDGGVSQIKALAGSTVGGEDLLQNMMRHLLPDSENIFKSHGVKEIESMALLRVATQDAIHQLSSQISVQVDVNLGDGLKIFKVVDRAEFEEVNKEVFEKCESLIIQCIRDAKVEAEDVNDVIIVGGCSYIPKVKNLVTNICKVSEVYKDINPLEGAVCGAAMEGAVASGIVDPFGNLDLLMIQATPLAIGIRADGNGFVPVIPKNTRLPARKDLIFTTIHDNQSEALIVVYEGEGKQVEKNHLLGYLKIMGIPAAPKGVPEISVCMDVDTANVLTVLAGVVMPGSRSPALPFMQVRMPMVDDAQGWCAEALNRTYGATMDLVTLKKA
ncbi:heat shock 70 kDa protein 8-like [Vicia villosa]|uniref:heat shock 70 kDa protein 8-like n=1 Tax=Vicia villosa TaxID=3911 RepID=UPI00273BD994|nr:heat shock 70 kDa protein 8-like [Vicia villosa]